MNKPIRMEYNQIIQGDALEVLRGMPSGIVQSCVTSPPYYSLRDYGTAKWEGGSAECDHKPDRISRIDRPRNGLTGGLEYMEAKEPVYKDTCSKCGATRIDQQIGLEDTPSEYIARLVEVFREVRRVLRDDGTLWVNIGDSYAAGTIGRNDSYQGRVFDGKPVTSKQKEKPKQRGQVIGLKPKDLIGIPWMLAFALRADGWYLRADLIWHKPNCMPESVTDRPTKAHEYIFLLSKSSDYYYDGDSIREPQVSSGIGQHFRNSGRYVNQSPGVSNSSHLGNIGSANGYNPAGRNKRSVWTVSTSPFSEAHFATFPPKLIEPCILAGTSPQACEVCGAPWERVTEHTPMIIRNGPRSGLYGSRTTDGLSGTMIAPAETRTTGWQPTCTCDNTGSGACVVLDPFAGAGTVPLVTLKYQRQYIGIELNPSYCALIQKRIHIIQPVLWDVSA